MDCLLKKDILDIKMYLNYFLSLRFLFVYFLVFYKGKEVCIIDIHKVLIYSFKYTYITVIIEKLKSLKF